MTIVAECDRFLYNMMRMLSGTLVQVGLGELTVADVEGFVAGGGRAGKGPRPYKAPARGLCLDEVFYDEAFAHA